MNSMKRQKDVTLRNEPPRSMGIQYTTGKEQKKKKKKIDPVYKGFK